MINRPIYETPTHYNQERKDTLCNFCNKIAIPNRDGYIEPYTYYCKCEQAKLHLIKWE